MLVSYNWLNSYFDNTLPSAKEVADAIALHAFEVEEVCGVGDDTVIDIDVLPNRGPDALSHRGVAREIGVILDLEPDIPEIITTERTEGADTRDHLTVSVKDPELVSRVSKRFVDNIAVQESPAWLQKRLEVLGQQPINNVVDVTNYVMFETGQPIHAFDYDKLGGEKKQMVLRRAKEGEAVVLLDEKERMLDLDTLVWADEAKALDVAGIKGGANSGVDENTKRIVLSACNFDPVHIRKTRQRLKIVTDASKRFEQGVTPERTMIGIELASKLLRDVCGANVGEAIDIYEKPVTQETATVTTRDINRLLGTELTDAEVEKILTRFEHAGFSWEKKGETYHLLVPLERPDVRTVHEVVEEIGRIYGYNNITSAIPDVSDFAPHVNRNHYYILWLKKFLVEQGFSEVSNYMMRGKGELEIANSLIEGMEFFRTDVFESMAENLIQNSKNFPLLGLEQIRLFEIGKVFSLEDEHWALGIGVKNHKGWKGESEKEVIQSVIKRLNTALDVEGVWEVKEVSVPTQDDPQGKGVVAELNAEAFVETLPLPDSYKDVLLPERPAIAFASISQYPFVTRDIALWVKEATAEEVEKVLVENAGDLLTRTTLFDTFEKDGRTSYAFRLVFQSHEKTLTDEEVNDIMERIGDVLKEKDWEIR